MLLPEPFPPGLNKDQERLLRSRADDLFATLGLGDRPSDRIEYEELRALQDWFRSNRLLGRFFIHAMVAWVSDRSPVNRLQAHVLAASVHDAKEGNRLHVALAACRRIRQLHEGQHEALLLELKDFTATDSASALNWLSDESRKLRTRKNASAGQLKSAHELGRFKSLLKRYVRNVVRTQNREAIPTRHGSSVASLGEGGSESDADIGERHDFYDGRKEKGDDVECRTPYMEVYPRGTTATKRSGDLQRGIAAGITSVMVGRNMLSPVSWGVFSEGTFTGLVRELRAGVLGKSPEHAILAASLFTGRSAEDLVSMPLIDHQRAASRRAKGDVLLHPGGNRKFPALRSELSLAAPDRYPEFYAPAKSSLDIPLPSELLPCLERARSGNLTIGTVKERLGELRKKLPQLSLARIALAGRLWLYHQGSERPLIDRLFGTDLAHAVPLYYQNMAEEWIMNAYGAWMRRINGQLLDANPFTVEIAASVSRVGSLRCPKLAVVGEGLRQYRDLVRWELANGKSLREAHNHYAVFTYLVLAFATGIRSVRQPFESLAEFCEATDTYFLDDKESRRAPAPRFVPVAPFAVKQLGFYFKYLLALKSFLDGHAPSRRYMDAVLKGQAPYLFTLGRGGRPPVALTPTTIANTLGEAFPLVSNWNRHFMRTELGNYGVSDEVIQAMMGHGEVGQEPFAGYSALSMSELEEAASVMEEIAASIGLEPLAGVPGRERAGVADDREGLRALPVAVGIPRSREFAPQRERNADERKRVKRLEIERGNGWADARRDEVRSDPERFRDHARADTWLRERLGRLNEELKAEYAWNAARARLCKHLDALNRDLGLNIPVPAPPRRLRRGRRIRTRAMFDVQRVVQRAAREFIRALARPDEILELDGDKLLPLVVFSAACFGGLAQPEALLEFARSVQRANPRLFWFEDRELCWMDVRFDTKGRNNILDDGRPRCLRRFLLDGITLMLLTRYLNRRARAASTVYKDEGTLMGHVRGSINQLCGAHIPTRMSLSQFAMGAITVAERRPGVRLPHYLVEYACGAIDSVSLPEEYFRYYLGEAAPARAATGKLPRVGRTRIGGADGKPDPEIDRNWRRVKSLFKDMAGRGGPGMKRRLIEKMDALLADSPPRTVELLVRWLMSLLTVRRLAAATARRYSIWIARGWLVEFDGVDFEGLSAESWYEKYSDLIDGVPESQRRQVAGRLDDFHHFLSETQNFPAISGALQRSYAGKRMVRAEVIREGTFGAFKRELLASDIPEIEPGERERLLWIFVLCYRLGTRVGETSRVLWSDIEQTSDPLLKLRANRFGKPKNKTPHQLAFEDFLPRDERLGLRKWLDANRRFARSEDEPVFGPPNTSAVVYSATELAKFFTLVMSRVSGLHFSPHSCRHTAASRLALLAEDEPWLEEGPYSEAERLNLKRAVFTGNARGRDRMWHLRAVFDHQSPETTLGDYVHVLDLLLRGCLARGGTRLPPKAVASIVGCCPATFASIPHCDTEGFPVEKALSIVRGLNAKMFKDVVAEAAEETAAPERVPDRAPGEGRPERIALAQIMLEEIENGQEPESVAIRYGQGESYVKALHRAAVWVAGKRTRVGASRVFSKARLRSGRTPIAPTRLREGDDQKLMSRLIPALLEYFAKSDENKARVCETCRYWLEHTTTSSSGLSFRSPDRLNGFLDCFVKAGTIPNSRWMVEVSPPGDGSDRDLRKAWTVVPGMDVRIGEAIASGSDMFPLGTASLHLQVKDSARVGVGKDTSKLLKYVLHMFCVVLEVRGRLSGPGASG